MEVNNEVGVVIGKFYPFHAGHELLLQTALSQCAVVHCIICYKEDENPCRKLRGKWIKELYPLANVHFLLDVYDPDDSELWAQITMNLLGCDFPIDRIPEGSIPNPERVCPMLNALSNVDTAAVNAANNRPTVVFTSEDYGSVYAKFMQCRHILVDKNRAKVPTSGTATRTAPLSQWDYMSKPLREYYAQRVVLVGSESTGKSTLTEKLTKRYATTSVEEYGRLYTEIRIAEATEAAKASTVDTTVDAIVEIPTNGDVTVNNDATDTTVFTEPSTSAIPRATSEPRLKAEQMIDNCISLEWDTSDFLIIAEKQNEIENAAARECNKVVICDTDSFATYIWHEHYIGHNEPEVLHIFNQLRETTDFKNRHYLLMSSTGVPFVQDGTRDGEHHRQWMYDRFLSELQKEGLSYTVLSGGYEDREKQAIDVIDELLRRGSERDNGDETV